MRSGRTWKRVLKQSVRSRRKSSIAVADKYIHPDHMLVIEVGDKAKIESGLKDLKLGRWKAGARGEVSNSD
jgi:hypothetical protein